MAVGESDRLGARVCSAEGRGRFQLSWWHHGDGSGALGFDLHNSNLRLYFSF